MTSDSALGALEIHTLNAGVGVGESIVLRLPNGRYGVVDSYCRSLSDPSTNPTVIFLRDREVSELEFVCITHPHEDHYHGMEQLLNAFSVRSFWRFGALDPNGLKLLVNHFKIGGRRAGVDDYARNGQEFARILAAVRELARRGRDGFAVQRINSRMQVYPTTLDTESRFQIWGIAPSSAQIERYESALHNCFDKKGKLKQELPYGHHNLVSVALVVEFGDTRVVLGGDVESAGWRDAIRNFGAPRLAAHVVKVSHHGSTNGYTRDLWKHFAAGDPPIAVVTPFQRFGLPKTEALRHIGSHARTLVSTFAPTREERRRQFSGTARPPAASRAAMRSVMDARARSETSSFGRCSLVFNDKGQCLNQELVPPARDITVRTSG